MSENEQESAQPQWRPLTEDERPQAGDIATHTTVDLDSRQVAHVDLEKGVLWLNVVHGAMAASSAPIGPFPIENYRFERKVG